MRRATGCSGAVPSDFRGDAAGLRRAAVLGDNPNDTRLENGNLAVNYRTELQDQYF